MRIDNLLRHSSASNSREAAEGGDKSQQQGHSTKKIQKIHNTMGSMVQVHKLAVFTIGLRVRQHAVNQIL